MNEQAVKQILESMGKGSSKLINNSVVTKWNNDKFEIDTWGKYMVSQKQAIQLILV